MKVSYELKGPKGRMMSLEVTWHGTSDEDEDQIHVALQPALLAMANAAPAAEGHKQYSSTVDFKGDRKGEAPKGKTEAKDTEYSAQLDIEEALITALSQLVDCGRQEVMAGQRT